MSLTKRFLNVFLFCKRLSNNDVEVVDGHRICRRYGRKLGFKTGDVVKEPLGGGGGGYRSTTQEAEVFGYLFLFLFFLNCRKFIPVLHSSCSFIHRIAPLVCGLKPFFLCVLRKGLEVDTAAKSLRRKTVCNPLP